MAHSRPAYTRHDTDISMTEMQSSADHKPFGTSALNKPDKHVDVNVRPADDTEPAPAYDNDDDLSTREPRVVHDAKDIVTTVITVEDDPSLNPWTFRMFILGIGLAIFGAVLQEIFYFKPQVIYVSLVFLTVIAYVLGEAMAYIIPRTTRFGRFLNPGPFNLKEHAAISIMASAGAQSALSTQALAAQQLYYGGYPSHAAGVFLTISSQLVGYGVAGLLREVLVYPTRMLWPINLPVTTLLESLHKDKAAGTSRLKLFYCVFGAVFVWECFPEYIFPVLEGVSVFCLANRHSAVFTNLFGGVQGNEGLGFLSICFDWQYIASLGSPIWVPLQTLTNSYIGYLCCITLFMGLYYTDTWRALSFPFLSQLLYDTSSTSASYAPYNQTAIFAPDNTISRAALADQGLPWLTATYIGYLITSNAGLTATFVHMLLWNWEDVKLGFVWCRPTALAALFSPATWRFWDTRAAEERRARRADDPATDPHYRLMLAYRDAPQWWYAGVFVATFVTSLGCLYAMHSTLPWWGFVVSILLLALFTLFFGAQYGVTGFQFNVQPICQMFAGYLFPGRPLANMYFTVFSFNAMQQAQLLARDLKLGQYVHLSPRATFTAQMTGSVVGALFNYIMMLSIVRNQATILTSIEGTNIWSGQNIQQLNTLAIAWSMAGDLFGVGARYQWVTLAFLVGFLAPLPFWIAYRFYPYPVFKYLNTSIILWTMGYLFVGTNASITSYFAIGFFAQGWLRRKRPAWFVRYNYLVSAALDGGTQVLVFILTFAVFGGSGIARPFPYWAGNPDPASGVQLDYCMAAQGVGG